MSLIVGHPTGNANSRAAISGFYDAGLLVEFHTAIAAFPGSFLDKISYIKALSEIRRRAFDQKLSSVTKTHLLKETIRLLATKIGFEGLIKHETGLFSVDAVYRYIDQKVSSALNKRSFSGDSIHAKKTGFIDRKSTRLNSSHVRISYAVFCLKKKNKPALTCHVDVMRPRAVHLPYFTQKARATLDSSTREVPHIEPPETPLEQDTFNPHAVAL